MSARCSCGADAYSLNPAEVVVHRTDGPCTIELAQNLTAGVNDRPGSPMPDGADDAPDESKGDADQPSASHSAPAVTTHSEGMWL